MIIELGARLRIKSTPRAICLLEEVTCPREVAGLEGRAISYHVKVRPPQVEVEFDAIICEHTSWFVPISEDTIELL